MNITLFIGLIVLGIALQICFMATELRKKYTLAVLLKGLASACFVALGCLTSRGALDGVFAKYILFGLLFGMAGDILLNLRFLFEKKGNLVFLVGILIFLLGHVMYLIAILPFAENKWLGFLIGACLTALTLWQIFKRITAKPAFKIFGVFYIGAIVIMTTFACMNLISGFGIRNLVFFVGALLFLASDIVLIINTFGGKQSAKLRITNLSLYYVGQILIALCLLAA